MEKINKRCISRKEYLKKYDSNVGYALYVQDNIRKDDYIRLNTGNIVKVIGIKANTVNKRAIYYGFYKQDWFDSAAVENFSDNIIDLIEVGDFVNGHRVKAVYLDGATKYIKLHNSYDNGLGIRTYKEDIKTILTKEMYAQNCYKVGGKE